MAPQNSALVALMSIHPKYAHAILDGTKTVEFRKQRLRDDITHVVIYATCPVQAVLGYFEIGSQEEEAPRDLWERFGAQGVIDESDFFSYFDGKDIAVGITVANATKLRHPRHLDEALGVSRPPQSFQYLPARCLDALQVAS